MTAFDRTGRQTCLQTITVTSHHCRTRLYSGYIPIWGKGYMILQLNHHPAATTSLLNFCFRSCDVLSVTFWPCNKNRFAVFTNFSSPFLKHTGWTANSTPLNRTLTAADWVVAELVPIILITSWSQTTVFPSCHCSIIKPNLRVAAIKDPTVIVGICKDSLLQLIVHTTFLLW